MRSSCSKMRQRWDRLVLLSSEAQLRNWWMHTTLEVEIFLQMNNHGPFAYILPHRRFITLDLIFILYFS
jgi:hypothetical protein